MIPFLQDSRNPLASLLMLVAAAGAIGLVIGGAATAGVFAALSLLNP